MPGSADSSHSSFHLSQKETFIGKLTVITSRLEHLWQSSNAPQLSSFKKSLRKSTGRFHGTICSKNDFKGELTTYTVASNPATILDQKFPLCCSSHKTADRMLSITYKQSCTSGLSLFSSKIAVFFLVFGFPSKHLAKKASSFHRISAAWCNQESTSKWPLGWMHIGRRHRLP